MRELKFRAWDKENNFMFYYGNNYPLSKYYLGFNHKNHNNMSLMILIDPSDSEFKEIEADIMQYTGLKDCKGREIYEGDILKFKDGLITEVEISPAYGVYGVIDFAIKRLIGKSHPEKNCEVIGNIYENKELLEGKDDCNRIQKM